MKQDTRSVAGAGQGKPSRNAPCHCGSGEKYKRCCGAAAGQPKAEGALPAPSGQHTAQSQYLHGVHLLRTGQTLAAMSSFLAAAQLDPTHFEAHHALGLALMQSGRLAEASAILYQAAALRPDSAAANWDLGAAYDKQNLHEQAIAAYRRAAELAPKMAEAHIRLGQLYAMYSRMEEAGDCLDRAADIKPNTTTGRLLRSDASLLRGDVESAEKWARKAVMLDQTSGGAQAQLAGLLYGNGRFEEAAAHFETALRLDPKSAKCWDGLAHCRKYAVGDNAILGRMRGVLQRGGLQDAERMTLHFSMGKVHDDCGDYAQAMEQFDAANRLRANDLAFDRAGFASMVDRNIRHFTADYFARNDEVGETGPRPIFIVGMYRSGTTLAEQIITSHPDIEAGGELTLWAPADLEVDPVTGRFDPDRTPAAIARYRAALRKIGPAAACVTDKLPTNFFRLGAIHALLPDARIIHCQRDPIDTCLSIYSTLFNTRIPFAARKSDLVFCYEQYLRMMGHWRKVLPCHSFTDVHYEQLVSDREDETRRLIAFTGLDWNESCLQPERNKRAISTSSAWQVRQPIYATSVQRWRRYEPWIGELRKLLPSTA